MKTIGFVLQNDFQLMAVAALPVFEFANLVLQREAYRVVMLSENGGPIRASVGVVMETKPLAAIPDTLMVVGQSKPQPINSPLRNYIKKAATDARRLAGVCTGAFALGEAGVLDGRSATTHWWHARDFQARFPLVKVDADRIFVVDGNIWTSAGMTAAIDLALALIEDDHGVALARDVARRLVVYHRRPGGQSQFSALLELEPRSDRIRRALIYAKEHLSRPLSVQELAEVANLSPRQFSRTFMDETGQSPAKAVERLRLEAACALLEEGRHPLDVIARDTGFADRDRMRRAFVRKYGHPPLGLRRSFRLINGDPPHDAPDALLAD
jgi:transcriptional regulator GlxA family with amidase domain